MVGHWSAYEYQPSFVLGFHGCDAKVGEEILAGAIPHLKHSEQKYDWLGHGIYFWEGNPRRAYEWAVARQDARKIEQPFVIGAIIDLRHCLDLFDSEGLQLVAEAYNELAKTFETAEKALPRNVGDTPDRAGRMLDCAVLNFLHEYYKERDDREFDSIRGPFLEGEPLYPNAGFRSQNHIQICVRNTDCIKGYFRPLTSSPT